MARQRTRKRRNFAALLRPRRYLSYIFLVELRLVDPNVFETANAGFAQAMYEEFLRDPAAVGPEWRRLFESGVVGERNGAEAGKRADQITSGAAGQRDSQSTPATSTP